MKKLFLSFAVSALLAPTTTFSITSVEAQFDPPEGWSGYTSLSLGGQSGNTDKQGFDWGLLIRHRRDDAEWLVLSDFSYGKSQQLRDEENGLLHLRRIERDFLPSQLDWELFAQTSYDDFKADSKRHLFGGGIRRRYQRLTNPELSSEESKRVATFNAIVGVGLFYEDERSLFEEESGEAVRMNIYGQWLWDRTGSTYPIKLFTTLYIQPELKDFSDTRAIASVGVDVPLSTHLSLACSLELDHDSEPLPGVKSDDFDYGIEVKYRF